jgi:lipopolysaccharide biosynthesis glycosyltransferase
VLRAIALKTLALPFSAPHLVAIPGEATFQCPVRVSATAHALKEMEPVVIALASNENYFPGLYCAVASALSHLNATREVDLKVLDGGISKQSKDTLSRLVERCGKVVRLQFVAVDDSLFHDATLGPAQSHMTYCRTLLPRLLDVPRLIYLDCDALVFRDLSELFDLELSSGKILAAVPDSETLTLGDDSYRLAGAMNLPADGRYFNAGVMLLNLDELRKQNFTEKSLEFFENWRGHYRFHDQSAINFLLHRQIDKLPEHWNRASWRFDEQDDNHLDCVLHYTRSAPWLGGTTGPAQVLFERFAADAGSPVNRRTTAFKKSRRQQFLRNVLAPFRALGFPVVSFLYKIAGQKEKCAGYQKAARYWLHYVFNAPRRRSLHQRRAGEIQGMKFKFAAFESAT